jgi:Lrp/AsnC family transcriptional regulator for asnA, asnC and gidA
MDELDLAIIDALKANGRRPFTDIAQAVGVSEGTVRNRVTRLIENRILHIVGLVDPSSLGFNAPAMIGVSISDGDIEEIGCKIAQFPEVSYLIMVSGEFDLIVEVLCRDREHLANFLNQDLRRVPGVGRTQTFMTLRTFKMAYGAPPILGTTTISGS